MRFRLNKAKECLDDAENALESGSLLTSVNRAYYCILHAMRAVLAIDRFDSKKHMGVIAAFRQKYIKTGIFPMELSNTIRDAYDSRGNSDYEDFFEMSCEDAAKQVESAKAFFAAIETFLAETDNGSS